MLHELLFALNGYAGPIFMKDEFGIVKVQKGLPFISEAEESILDRILTVATHYNAIKVFQTKYEICSHSYHEEDAGGLYMSALCIGLKRLLKSYHNDLINLESQVLTDSHLNLSHVLSSLNEYYLLFPAITSMLKQITSIKAHGCQILEILYQSSQSGIPLVKSAVNEIINVCLGVMYKQLSAWMLYGLLVDGNREFFIKCETEKSETDIPRQPSDMISGDELRLRENQSSHVHNILKQHLSSHHNISQMKFVIDSEILPSFIPVRVAEKIIFVGESVQMFGRNTSKNNEAYESILQDKIEQFSKDIFSLSKLSEFSVLKFDATVNTIRDYTAEKLWSLVIIEGELPKNLKIVKDFFLLGRGELFLAFIDHAQEYLQYPPSTNTQQDVNNVFQLAANDIYFSDDALLQKFKFVISGKIHESREIQSMKKTEERQCDGWQQINLQYAVDWPLHIIFTSAVLERYNLMFQYLLQVRKVQLELQKIWALSMSRWFKEKNVIINKYGWLRTHMIFLIDNLQYYLMVDVIESQFSILMKKIDKTKDFVAIQIAHDSFLSSLLKDSFRSSKPIFHHLNELMNLCLKFCSIITKASMIIKDANESSMSEFLVHAETQLEDITKSFERHSKQLFDMLSCVQSHQESSHLVRFMLRIDFNKYFTLAGDQSTSFTSRS